MLRRLSLFVAFGLFAAACSGGGGETTESSTTLASAVVEVGSPETVPVEPVSSITIAAAHDVVNFNVNTAEGDRLWPKMIMQSVWPIGTRIRPDYTIEPVFFTRLPEVISEVPFVVRYQIRGEAEWSDGTPVSVSDLRFYLDNCNSTGHIDDDGIVLEESDDCSSVAGYEQVTNFEVVDLKTAHITFDGPYADYLTLFSSPMPPAHLGQDWSTGFERFDETTVLAAGPFKVVEHRIGVEVRLARNESWFGEPALVDELVFKVIDDVQDQVTALKGGVVDVIYPAAQVELLPVVDDIAGVVYSSEFGPIWEHITFNTETMPLLVRQAVAQAINREAILESVVRPFGAGAMPLGNRIFVTGQAFYEDHTLDEYRAPDPEHARNILLLAGYFESEDEEDPYLEDGDGNRLQLRLRTTGGNTRREQVQLLIKDQLAVAGIEVIVDNLPGQEVLGPIFRQDFDLALFAWVGSPLPAGIAQRIFGRGSAANAGLYDDPLLDESLERAVAELDLAEQAKILNEADKLMWRLLPNFPLYQLPTFLAHDANLIGVVDNATEQGLTWDVASWGWRPGTG